MIQLCINETTWIQRFSENVIAPITVATIAYFLFGKMDEYRKRRSFSRLGAAIIHTLIEEVKNGRDSIRRILDPNNSTLPNPLPRKSWNGINTVPDEVLLRILELAKDTVDVGFPAAEIRTHTKNYFDHMVTNWDGIVEIAKKRQNFKAAAHQQFSTYDKDATGVLEMLKHVKVLLEKNSTRLFPR